MPNQLERGRRVNTFLFPLRAQLEATHHIYAWCWRRCGGPPRTSVMDDYKSTCGVVGTNLGSSTRTINAYNCWAVSPVSAGQLLESNHWSSMKMIGYSLTKIIEITSFQSSTVLFRGPRILYRPRRVDAYPTVTKCTRGTTLNKQCH